MLAEGFFSNSPEPFSDTILEESPWLVALGDPGSGKTTALKSLLLDYIAEARHQFSARYSGIPIFVSLRDFAREHRSKGQGYSLLAFMYDQAKGHLSTDCSSGFFEHYLKSGECLICFDGLDEVTVPELRHKITNIVENFARRYPRNRYTVTSRAVGYGQAPLSDRLFSHYKVLPLQNEDIRRYVSLWYRSREKSPEHADKRSAELLDTLTNSKRLHDLAQNPLLLAIIALVHRIEAELPHERVKLYDKCSEALLTTWDAAIGLKSEDYTKPYYTYRREILESVAYWMQIEMVNQSEREVIVSEPSLQLSVKKHLEEDPTYNLSMQESWHQADSFIKLIKERTGLLIERGEGQFAFVHLTFQEYFTASYIWRNYIHDHNAMWDIIEPHVADPSWREVILLLLGKLGDYPRIPTLIIKKILDDTSPNEYILRQRLSLAASSLTDHIRIDTYVINEIISRWLDILRSPLCDQQVNMALSVLSQLKEFSFVQSELRKVAEDNTESARLRTQISSLYIVNDGSLDWAYQVLSMLCRDPKISGHDRAVALAFMLDTESYADTTWPLVIELMCESQSSADVCADVLIDMHYHEKFAYWLHFHTSLKLVWDEKESLRIIKNTPRLAIILGLLGWEKAWLHLIDYLTNITEKTEELEKLLPIFHKFTPKHFIEPLASALIAIAKSSSFYPINSGIVHNLLELGHDAEDIFSLLLGIDAQADLDDWNVEAMSQFFTKLLNSNMYLFESITKTNNDDHLPIEDWVRRIDSAHLTLQISFVEGLRCLRISEAGKEIAKKFSIRLTQQKSDNVSIHKIIESLGYQDLLKPDEIEELFRPILNRNIEQGKNPYVIWKIANYFNRNGFLTSKNIIQLVMPVLNQPDDSWKSRWAVGSAAISLHGAGLLPQKKAIEILLKCAVEENKEINLKQSIGSELIKLGAIQEGAQILQSVIMDTSNGDINARNEAFLSLRGNFAPELDINVGYMARKESYTI